MSNSFSCPNCLVGSQEIFFSQNSVPVNSCILLATEYDAKNYPRGKIELAFCSDCGFISNVAFDPALIEYSSRYEETQAFSPTFNSFHEALADRMVNKYKLTSKEIIEIGCGKGEFLNLICKLGDNKGIGFDPGYQEDRQGMDVVDDVSFIKDFYSQKYANYQGDFVCCKMTLEHIPKTSEFLDQVGHSIDADRGTVVFFQVPDALRILSDCAYEDIYYEHCSYFYSGSLERLFLDKGLDILSLDSEYDGQYLTIEAKATSKQVSRPIGDERQLQVVRDYVASFSERHLNKVKKWQAVLDENFEDGKKVVLWGSGSKGVSFLSSLRGSDRIEYVVDINPFRQDHFMSGSGQRIVSPDYLEEYQPDLVIVMNQIYVDEIRGILHGVNLNPEILAL